MFGIPEPRPIPAEDVNRARLRISFRYLRRKGSWSWSKFTAKDKAFTAHKLREIARLRVCDFRAGVWRPRKWHSKLPSPPEELSEDIQNNLADYFNINRKIRIFGYLLGRTFYVIWVTSDHKHSK